MRVPSGDQMGSLSLELLVTGTEPVPSGLIVRMPDDEITAMRLPSGDQSG